MKEERESRSYISYIRECLPVSKVEKTRCSAIFSLVHLLSTTFCVFSELQGFRVAEFQRDFFPMLSQCCLQYLSDSQSQSKNEKRGEVKSFLLQLFSVPLKSCFLFLHFDSLCFTHPSIPQYFPILPNTFLPIQQPFLSNAFSFLSIVPSSDDLISPLSFIAKSTFIKDSHSLTACPSNTFCYVFPPILQLILQLILQPILQLILPLIPSLSCRSFPLVFSLTCGKN